MSIPSGWEEVNILFYPFPQPLQGGYGKAGGAQACCVQWAGKVVSWRRFWSTTVKGECVLASTKSGNFPSCGTGGLKRCLPHLKCLLSKPACTGGICPSKPGGVLGELQLVHNQP